MATKRILIVEDSPELCSLWKRLFAGVGIEIESAVDGRSAVEKIKRGLKVDLLLTDYYLPDLSGAQLIREVREIYPDLRCIVVTGSKEEAVHEEVFKFGNVRLLNKPIKFTALHSAVKEAIH